jgi:O-antigen ligase
MENVHSLYIWILTRMGPVGLVASLVAMILILVRIREVYRVTRDEHYQILVGVILLSVVMYLFNGFFNPVYANVRHLVPLGLSLALVTQLPQIMARRQSTQAAGP